MNINDSDYQGGHEIDSNLVEIADMLRIQEDMHEVTEHDQDRMRKLMPERRGSTRFAKSQPQRQKSQTKAK